MRDFNILEQSRILLWTSSKHTIVPKTVNTISIDALVHKLQALEF